MKTAAKPAEEILRVRGLAIRVGERELDFELRADLEVGPGERVVLMGPSGSGKSTLLRAIAGIQEGFAPLSGSVRLGERELSGLPPEERDIGFVFQDQALFPSLSVLENAAFGLRMRGVPRSEREAQVRPWLEKLGLTRYADSQVGGLSGGEAQRVAFVRALVWKPRLLLLDEPFSALDPALRDRLRLQLLELHREWPVPMLLVTHDEADVRAIATRTLTIALQQGGAVRQVVPFDN